MKIIFTLILCILGISTAFTITLTETIQISYGVEFDVSPGDDIQTVINDADVGDTINFAAGTYTLSSTLNLSKSIILVGADGTILDVSGVTGYGVNWTGDDITMKNFEVQSGGTPVTYTLKISGADNVTLDNVTVKDSQKTAVDLNGVNGATLTDVTATDTVAGFGIAMVDSDNITLTDITTSGNAWGGVTIQTEGYYHEGGADNIAFEGSFDVSEGYLLLEQDPCRSDGGPAGCTEGDFVDITNVKTPAKYEFASFGIRNPSTENYKQTLYVEILATAKTYANSMADGDHTKVIIHDVPSPGTSQSSVESKEIDNLYLTPSLDISDTFDVASSGNTIHFESGTYTDLGQITIDKSLTLISETGDYRTTGVSIEGDSYIKITGDTDDVTIQGLKFKDITNSPVAVIHSLPGDGQSHENILIEKNSFENTNKHAIKTNISNDHFIINDNKIVNTGNGNPFVTAIILFAMNNGKVTNNIIDTTTFGGINLGGNDSPVKNTIVSGNMISDTFENGIQLANSLNSNVTITENTITNANTDNSPKAGAISVWTDSSNATVTKNTMKNNYNGLVICGGPSCGYPPDPENDSEFPLEDDIIFKENVMSKNDGKAVVNLSISEDGTVPTLVATENYWGSKKGPNHSTNNGANGDEVDDNVTFTPWYIDSGLSFLNEETLPTETIIVFAEDNLQDAIDNADNGATITLQGGTHDVGAITIDKPITITSDTGDYRTTTVSIEGDSYIRIIGDTDNVAIQGLKFKDISSNKPVIHSLPGSGQTHENILIEKNSFENIANHAIKTSISNDNFVINDNKVTNSGSEGGFWTAILIFAMDNGKVTNNIIDTSSFAGINLGGNDSPIKNTIVSGNTISNTYENGIQLANSLNSNVTITENTITNANTNDANNAGAISIWTDSSNATVTKNTMKNNHNGLVICGGPSCGYPPDPLNDSNEPLQDDIVFQQNMIFKNNGGEGVVNLAPTDGGTSPTFDASNNYWGNKKGPTHSSNTDGDGVDVDDNVTFTPWYINSGLSALNTELGTGEDEKKIKPTSDKVTFDDGDDTTEVKGQAALPADIVEIELQNDAVLDVTTNVGEKTGDNIKVSGSDVDLKTFAVKKKDASTEAKDLTKKQKVASVEVEVAKAVKMKSGTASEPIKIKNTALPKIEVSIPDETTILAPTGWAGTIQPPKTASNSGTAPSGFSVGNNAIEVGSPNAVLLFDSPVTLTLEGVTGAVGYKPAGSTTWVQITETCGGTYASPDEPSAFPGECFISDGTNTKIVTYHFTSFAGLSASVSSSSGGGGSSDDDTKPVLQSNSLSSPDSNIYAGTLKLDDSARNSTSIFETGDTIDLELSFYENSGPQSLEHVTLFTDIRGFEDRYDSNLYVEWNKDKPLKIFDSEGYLDDSTDVSFVERDNNLVMVFHLNFVKPMDASHIVLNFWDYKRNSGLVTFDDAIRVVKHADEIIAEISGDDSATSNLEESSVEVTQKAPLAIPAWIKNNAGWWADGQIEDGTFTNGIQYLIDEKIINVPIQPNISKDPAVVEEPQNIPEWVRNSASWWADDLISENEFVNSIQWLVTNGILKI